MFFQTNSGAYFNTQHIAALIPCHDSGKETRFEIVTSGGTTHIETVLNNKIDDIILGPQVIPAAPGYERLAWSANDTGEDYVERSPIVGWRLNDMGVAEPVIPDAQFGRYSGIATPAGKIIVWGDGTYDTLDEWRAENRRLRDERIARAAA